MEKQTITIYDVAREAGVSMATVSRVVNGNPNVKPSTRKKVSEVIERLDYRPNAVARGLASKKTTTVGVILPSVTNLFFSSLARGIDDIASMYKYNIILANSDESQEKEVQVFNTLLANQVDGIIFMGQNVSESIRKEIERTSTPVVFAGTLVDNPEYYSVNIDHTVATKEITAELLEHGRRVVLVTDEPDLLTSQHRLEGFKVAYEEKGVEFDEDLVIQQALRYTDADKVLEELQTLKADSVIVKEDTFAAALMNAALDAGFKVPEDLEVITSDNSIVTEIVRPKLTSIQQPLYDIGAVAMRLLTKIMSNEEVEEKQVILPYKIKHRGSTLHKDEN